MSKLEIYRALVRDRKACQRCEGLRNPSNCCGGKYDTEEIGPWSRWQGNVDAKLMVIGQDWGDEACFKRDKGKELSSNPTNKMLIELLKAAGVEIDVPTADKPDRGKVFFTNAILCLKQGGLQGPVRSEWFDNCGSAFLLPLVRLVRPRIVVTLGERAFGVFKESYQLASRSFREAVESSNGFP